MSRTLKNSIFWLVGQFWGVPSPWSTAFLHQEAPQTYSKRLPRERFFKNFLQNFWKIFWNFKKYFFGFLGPHSRSEIWLYQKKAIFYHFLLGFLQLSEVWAVLGYAIFSWFFTFWDPIMQYWSVQATQNMSYYLGQPYK